MDNFLEENVRQLLDMGFPCETSIRDALKKAQNDVNQAVAILTEEDLIPNDDMQGIQKISDLDSFAMQPSTLPSYDNAVQDYDYIDDENDSDKLGSIYSPDGKELGNFPSSALYDLENRVLTEKWNIPYRKDEALAKCLFAANRFAQHNLMESDELCQRFLSRSMVESFEKLLNNTAVRKWNCETQIGVYNMSCYFINLACSSLQSSILNCNIMNTLAKVLDQHCEFHEKNRYASEPFLKKECRNYEELFGKDIFAIGKENCWNNDYLMLTNLINRFGKQNGFRCLNDFIKTGDMAQMEMILFPLAKCCQKLNVPVLNTLIADGLDRVSNLLHSTTNEQLKEKGINICFTTIEYCKILALTFFKSKSDEVDNLQLKLIFRMLKSVHFNAKMNALRELTNIIQKSANAEINPVTIQSTILKRWLVEKKILSLAFEGNIDQQQYCDKMRAIIEFLGNSLTCDELTKIWSLQQGRSGSVIDNLHGLIAAAAVNFSVDLMKHLLELIHISWNRENDRLREKFLHLVSNIGREIRPSGDRLRDLILNSLWELAHSTTLSVNLIQIAASVHCQILSDCNTKNKVKSNYMFKCLEDIKKGEWVYPALRHIHQVAQSMVKYNVQIEKGLISEIKNQEILKILCNSLIKFHALATTHSKFNENTILDGRYYHHQYVLSHLRLLNFILDEGKMFIPYERVKEIWNCLVVKQNACDWDRETCYDWFRQGISDLEEEHKIQFLKTEIVKILPDNLSFKGFQCFKEYFLNVNKQAHHMKEFNKTWQIIDNHSGLIGKDFLWDICLKTLDEHILSAALSLLIDTSYSCLSVKLKNKPKLLHPEFIKYCWKRLKIARICLKDCAIENSLNVTQIASTIKPPSAFPLNAPPSTPLQVERLLLIMEEYIKSVEETYVGERSFKPHGASFYGFPITVICNFDNREDFTIDTHSNETIKVLRQKISNKVDAKYEQIHLTIGNKITISRDQRVLNHIDFVDGQVVNAKLTNLPTITNWDSSQTTKSIIENEEFGLPGYLISQDSENFQILYELANCENKRIANRANNLLKLIPTDPNILDSLDHMSRNLDGSLENTIDGMKSSNKISTFSEHFQKHFDIKSKDMSSFRLLYNLQVLSSKLVPITNSDEAEIRNAETFLVSFLSFGGVNCLVQILQSDGIPLDIDYEIRQCCYIICLQILKCILNPYSISEENNEKETFSNILNYGDGYTKAKLVSDIIQSMSVIDFVNILDCFMRVSWAAAAGKLNLANVPQLSKECVSRGRQNSTGSNASSGSDVDTTNLRAGICFKQPDISVNDSLIAKQSLELLVICLQLRSSLLASFYSLRSVTDYIIEMLVGCSMDCVRKSACHWFFILSQISNGLDGGHQQSAKQFILQVLLRAHLPFWIAASSARGPSQKKLNQCDEFFDLLSQIVFKLSISEQNALGLTVQMRIQSEVDWILNFTASENSDIKILDNKLISGHFKFVRTLLTCEGVNKRETGLKLIKVLINTFLFPASKLILSSPSKYSIKSDNEFMPICSTNQSRSAAYGLLTELAKDCIQNFNQIRILLTLFHHSKQSNELLNEWNHMPVVQGRLESGYVGLKNAGATCYMNSVLQQIFMIPNVAESILSLDDEEIDKDSILPELQHIFGHLTHSKLQYYTPEDFWKKFKLWGNGMSINVREQQDAFDFFSALIDQLDDSLKKMSRPELLKKKMGGEFSDQKICQGCPHKYERSEPFLSLSVTVKNPSLQESLQQFVKGELLEGDNAYFCEKCGEKRNTVKRMCIRTLPNLLVIQLKRFDYDWERNRALKFDDYFRFPKYLDMEPYTVEGVLKREESDPNKLLSFDSEAMDFNEYDYGYDDEDSAIHFSAKQSNSAINYELVGIVVHSGQANAGHYYSFIKERRSGLEFVKNRNKWFKFNDKEVEQVDLSKEFLENECFGGIYSDKNGNYNEERVRYWNAYLLFYERVPEDDDDSTIALPKKSKIAIVSPEKRKSSCSPGKNLSTHYNNALNRRSDSFIELTELIHKGEKKRLFRDIMPAKVSQVIRHNNLQFLKDRDVYENCYFSFIFAIVSESYKSAKENDNKNSQIYVECLELAIHFLCNTYFHTRKNLRYLTDDWKQILQCILTDCKEACLWLVEFLSSDGDRYITPFILKSSSPETRDTFSNILQHLFFCWYKHQLPTVHISLSNLLQTILSLIDKEVLSNSRYSSSYFNLLYNFALLGTKACSLLHQCGAFLKLVAFLLGDSCLSQEDTQVSKSPSSPTYLTVKTRRWSSIQVRDFEYLHSIISVIVLHYDVQQYQSEEIGEFEQYFPLKNAKPLLRMTPEIQQIIFENHAPSFIYEMLMGLKDVDHAEEYIRDMLIYCSFGNRGFSEKLLAQILKFLCDAPVNELKRLLSMLEHLLKQHDSLQSQRILFALDGIEGSFLGILTIMKNNYNNEPRRTYQMIKCVSKLAEEIPMVKSKIHEDVTKWQWAVNWLKQKMTPKGYSLLNTATIDSNELGTNRSFQRTVSAQHTLEGATALLESINDNSDMEFNDDDDSTTIPLSTQSSSSVIGFEEDSVQLATTIGSEDLE